MLNIHWPPLYRKPASGMVLTPTSLTVSTVPRTALSMVIVAPPLGPKTAEGLVMGLPKASHTWNFTGIVLPPFLEYTLVPSLLIGGKMPGTDPLHVPYVIVSFPLTK